MLKKIEKFIFAKIKIFYNRRKIKIKYIVSYIQIKNSIVEWGKQTIIIIKNCLFI